MSGCPIPLEQFAASTTDVRRARSLPAAAYTSPEFFEFEREVIFGRDWFCVGRVDQVPGPGDYVAFEFAGEPLVMVRGGDGQVRVLSAVCQHRGTIVVEGEGNCGRFLRCPYHWWTYDLDGRLVGAPEMHGVEEFERADHGLPRLAVEVWNGFVFACHDPQAAPLAPRLERLDAWLANYGLADLVSTPVEVSEGLPFNWKLMVENGIEPYHATFLHHAMVPAPKERAYEAMPHLDGEGQIVSIVYHGFLDAALNPTYRPLLPVIETLTEDERRRFGFGTVPPNLMLGWQSDMLFWFLVCPTSVGEVTLRWSYLVPRTTAELPVFGKLLAAVRSGIEDYNAEDLPMAVSMQRGLRSRYAPRGRYSHEEEVLVQFNRWLLERYRRAT